MVGSIYNHKGKTLTLKMTTLALNPWNQTPFTAISRKVLGKTACLNLIPNLLSPQKILK